MVDRVNGGVQSGNWFSAEDVTYLNIASTDIASADEGVVNSTLEEIVEIVEQKANIIAMQVEDGVALHCILGYAGGLTAGEITQMDTDITALSGVTAVALFVGELRVNSS